LNPTQAEELLDVFHQGEFAKASWNTIKQSIQVEDAIAHHIQVLQKTFANGAVKSRQLVVAVDCCNGACSLLMPEWLKRLGCEVLAINDDPTAAFPHQPEPRPATMAQLCAVVKAGHADIGFALDADGERLGVVTDTAESLSEEMTLAIASEIALRNKPGTVVTNVSTTGAIEVIAARHGGTVVRTPVGQTYISEGIIEHNGVIGGEGSGGITVPEVQLTHDSAAATGLILRYLAVSGQPISRLVEELPRFTVLKHNVAVEPNRLYSVLQEFRASLETEQLEYDSTDGLKITMPNGWVHVRASNTESMIRIIVEASETTQAHQLLEWVRDRLSRS
jgi:phosphomannomutase